jgi:hypothetical protein
MSIPSYNTPYAPPPRRGISGWQIAGIGCLGLFLLAAVGGILLVRTVKEKISHPSKNDVVGVAILAGQASIDGTHLRQAIVSYHQQHGHYPNTLEDMVQDGTVDGKLLHNALDDNPSPGHVSWRYTRPAENAPGSTPILSEPYQITVGGSTQPGKIVIALDGRSQANNQVNTPGTPTP